VAIVDHRLQLLEQDDAAAARLEQEVIVRLANLRKYEAELSRRLGSFLAAEVQKLI